MATRKEQAAQTQAELKSAARRVFERQGYLSTKITDITAEAGRATGSFYSHFSSKETLLEALLRDWLTQQREASAASAAGAGAGAAAGGGDAEPPPADLSRREVLRERVVAAYWDTYKAHRPEIRALQQAALVHSEFAERLALVRHAQLGLLRANLSALADAGYELPGDPTVVASAVNAMLEQFCQLWVIEGGEPIGRELGDEEAVDTLTDLILRGIAGRG